MREQWTGKMAEYNSCWEQWTGKMAEYNQSFSGLPNIPKTINQLCLFQMSQPFPNIIHPPNKETNPVPDRSHATNRQNQCPT